MPSNVFADDDRLRQVIADLLENAIKFTPEGGQVNIQMDHLDSDIQITICDTGSGIRADFLPYAFDRFTQAEVPSRHTLGGVGIGLAIARHIMSYTTVRFMLKVQERGNLYGQVTAPTRRLELIPVN